MYKDNGYMSIKNLLVPLSTIRGHIFLNKFLPEQTPLFDLPGDILAEEVRIQVRSNCQSATQ